MYRNQKDIDSFLTASQGLPSSSTPAPHRQLFLNSRDSPTILSKSKFMALAWHQIFQRNTTLSVAEIEQYDAQNEIAYGEYLRNLPLEYANSPLPTIPQGFGPPLPTNNPYSSQAIQVIVNQDAYTEKEREVE